MRMSTHISDCEGPLVLHFETEECLPCALARDSGVLKRTEDISPIRMKDIMYNENTKKLFDVFEVEKVPTFFGVKDCEVVNRLGDAPIRVHEFIATFVNIFSDYPTIVKDLLCAYANQKGYALTDYLDTFVKSLLARKEKLGYTYCPCRKIPEEGDILNYMCPCKWHQDEVKEDGKCTCGLFFEKGDGT